MVSKDQGIGGAILAVCVIVAIIYLVLVIDPSLIAKTGNDVRLYAVLVLVSVAFIAILAIGAWIGWTMATTPPPKPIEEITTEIEEKKEEPKTEQAESSATDATKKKK
jgi:predicted DNA-binding transcriptional regulator